MAGIALINFLCSIYEGESIKDNKKDSKKDKKDKSLKKPLKEEKPKSGLPS